MTRPKHTKNAVLLLLPFTPILKLGFGLGLVTNSRALSLVTRAAKKG